MDAHQDQFRALAETAADAIVTLDERDRVVYANPAAARLFGYTVEELLALPFSQLIPERFRARHREGIRRFIETGERRVPWDGFELPGLRRDGSEVPLQITFGDHHTEQGRHFTGVMRDLSHRQAQKLTLRETSETLAAIVRGSPFAVMGLSAEGRVVFWNPRAEQLFGWSEGEVIGNLPPVLPYGREDEHDALRVAGLRGETVAGYETVRLRKDGSTVEVSLSVAPLTTPEGAIRGVVAMYEDITVSKEAERARTRSEARLRFLAEAGRVLSSSLDLEDTLRQLARLAVPRLADWCAIYLVEGGAPRLVEVAHRDPERMVQARALRERYPPHPDAPHGVHAVLRTGEPELILDVIPEMVGAAAVDAEHARLIGDLDLRSILTVPLVARGVTAGAITLVRGVSGRRFDAEDVEFARELGHRAGLAADNARLYAEAQRRGDEEAALRQATVAVAASGGIDDVIQAIAEGALVAVGADGAFVERITESAEEMEVIAVRGALTPAEGARAPLAGSCAERALREGAPISVFDLEQEGCSLLHSVGAACDRCSALVLPLQNAGEPIGTLVLVRAGGRFSEKETERAATFAHLAALAFRRLHLLHETEARREELERVTESRARLMRGFSHDVKNPLGAADGHLELLEEGILGPLAARQKESVRRTRAAIGSALELIQDLVELARAEATLIKIERGPVDLAALVRDVGEEHRPAAERKGLALDLDLPAHLPIIESDSSRIRQIMGNLISNAVKYTDEGEVRITLETVVGPGGRGDGARSPRV